MEEYDDLVPTPNERFVGADVPRLDPRRRGDLDDGPRAQPRHLLQLITEFPPSSGTSVSSELNCSCNQLTSFRSRLKLRSLKFLKCNGNNILRLPPEIGQCARLKTLLCGENKLETVPVELAKLCRVGGAAALQQQAHVLPTGDRSERPAEGGDT